MTYKNKTIKKHHRGNWYARVRTNGKVHTIYGRTQIECYDKLKLIADKVESEKAVASANKYLARIGAIGYTTAPQIINLPPQIENTAKQYTLKEWYHEWLTSYKVGNVQSMKRKHLHPNKNNSLSKSV